MTRIPADIERTAYRHRLEAFLASRDAGRMLTAASLREGVRLRSLVESAADVADYAEEAIAIAREEYRPRLECREGCSYCCRKPGVLVTLPEFLRVLDHVRSTFSGEATAAVIQRARAYAAQIHGRSFNDPTAESVPCPLLVDERCSVYEVRPLVCRGYNSTSVEACRKAHDDPRCLVPMFAVIKDITDGASVGAAQGVGRAGLDERMLDLGTGLGIALSAGDGFAESIVEGGAALRPAEHATWVADLWAGVRETAREVGVEVESSEMKGL